MLCYGVGADIVEQPPVDRPHRDKRRRHNPPVQPAGSILPSHQPQSGVPRQPSDPQRFAQPDPLPSQTYAVRGGGGGYLPAPEYGAPPQAPPPANAYGQSSPYASQTPRPVVGAPRSHERRSTSGPDPRDLDGAADGEQGSSAVSRPAGATGEALSAGPAVREGPNGERRVASSEDVGGG